eukprot:TRINITY_DN10861_c0_g1_i4.p1 TRINITY_DN10861_c0_g1~~TRINITY_DN10861_c0_g1_i4.p1  ORF type:complete len:209 (+),score=-16.25 TRINITY_DN10861_c0_g1_i4:542-1168(+)
MKQMCGVQKLLLMLKAISCNFLCNLGIYYQIIYGKQNIYLFIFFFFFFYYIWLNQCFISYNFQPLKYFSKLQHSKSIYCTQSNLHKKIISKGTYFIIKSCFKLSISQKKLKNSTQFYLQKQQQQISSYQKQIICHNSPLQCGQKEPQENEINKKTGPENTNRTLKLSISQKKLKNSTQQQGQQQISSYQKINHLPQQSAMWSTATQRQ